MIYMPYPNDHWFSLCENLASLNASLNNLKTETNLSLDNLDKAIKDLEQLVNKDGAVEEYWNQVYKHAD